MHVTSLYLTLIIQLNTFLFQWNSFFLFKKTIDMSGYIKGGITFFFFFLLFLFVMPSWMSTMLAHIAIYQCSPVKRFTYISSKVIKTLELFFSHYLIQSTVKIPGNALF